MIEPLVSTQWVAEHLHEPGIRLVEISVIPFKYSSAGHLPGAIGLDWSTHLQDPARRDIITPADFETLLSGAGIHNDDHIVIYGDQSNWYAAYGFWLFSLYGHEKLSLMDGGRLLWSDQGRPLASDVPQFPRSAYCVRATAPHIRADRQRVLDHLSHPDMVLLDVRSEAEFSGQRVAPLGDQLTAHRGGHIPGARNVPWSRLVNEDGTFKEAHELNAIFEIAGVRLDAEEIITYCFVGERAAHTWFALTHILGLTNVRNYDGSWTEWGNGVGLPIAQGVA